jgi:hypothetical protein
VADHCTGDNPDCPDDEFVPAGTVCRPEVDRCDADESCDGAAAECPDDRGAAEICDGEDNDCDGEVNEAGVCNLVMGTDSFSALSGDTGPYPTAATFTGAFDEVSGTVMLENFFIPDIRFSFQDVFTFEVQDPPGIPTDVLTVEILPDGSVVSNPFGVTIELLGPSPAGPTPFPFFVTTGLVDRERCGDAGPLISHGTPLDPHTGAVTILGSVCVYELGDDPEFDTPFSLRLDGRFGGPDRDGDGIGDDFDKCPFVPNNAGLDIQRDTDKNGIGDACQCGDVTGEGITNTLDAFEIAEGDIVEGHPYFDRCDVNGDGVCNVTDALQIAAGQVSSAREDQLCPAWGTTACATDGDCFEGEFCDFPVGDCGFTVGSCRPVPVDCSLDGEPVCGCDATTYPNECSAVLAGTSVFASGICP